MSLLDTLVGRALDDGAPSAVQSKEAAAVDESVPTEALTKLADSLEFVSDMLIKHADDGLEGPAGIDVGQATDAILGGDYPQRYVSDAGGPAPSGMTLGQSALGMPGQTGESPNDNLGTRGVGNIGAGVAPLTNQNTVPGAGGPIPSRTVLASDNQFAWDRAQASMSRVWGRVKAASMRRTAAEDPSITPNIGGENQTGDPSSFAAGLTDPLAKVPQDPTRLIDLANTQGDKARAEAAKDILGSQVPDAASATLAQGSALTEHASGDEIPTVKAAQADFLRSALLQDIAAGG